MATGSFTFRNGRPIFCRPGSLSSPLLLLLIFSLLTCLPQNSAAEKDSFKHVLLLQSYNYGHPWEDDVTRSIKKTFDDSGDNIRLTVEFMDTKRLKSARHYQNLATLYREKFKNDTFDLIIANDDNALSFALDRRKELFGDAPIVFCGLSYNPAEELKHEDNVTGIVQHLEFKKTFQLALSLSPEISQFIVINDRTTSGLKRTPQIKQALAELNSTVPYTFYDNLTAEELRYVLHKSPPHTVLFLHLFNRDRSGKTLNNAEIFRLIHTSFGGPIYAVKKDYLQHGIIGGVLSDGMVHGAKAAHIALEVLRGADIRNFPLITDSVDLPPFSYPQLLKHGIALSSLPPKSQIFDRPFSFYQTYKIEIYLVAAIILLLFLIVVSLIFYITLRRRANHEVLLLRNYLSNIIDSMPSILVGLDADGKVTQWNSQAEKTSGVAAAAALGRPLEQVFPQLPVDMGQVNAAIRSRQTLFSRNQKHASDAETVYQDVTIYPLIADGVAGVVIRVDDVTERVRLEEMMVQTEKMLSIGGLAAGMAHEINNPLSIIIQSSQNASRRLAPGFANNQKLAQEIGIDLEKLDQYLERRGIHTFFTNIEVAVNRTATIITNMLSFSSTTAAQREMCSIVEIVHDALALAHNDYHLKKNYNFRNIDVQFDFPDDLPAVSVNRIEIQQVLFNLFKNSGQAMGDLPQRGIVPQIVVSAHVEGMSLILKLKDNGSGIPEAAQKRIFDPFYTTKDPGVGTGLGLSVSYFIIVKRHQGQFRVESEEGEGATFIVSLPLGE